MAEQIIQQPIFPDLPRETPAVNAQGDFMPLWSLGFANLFQALQSNYKNEGIMLPSLTSTQAVIITAKYNGLVGSPLPVGTTDISGQMIYNSTIAAPQVFIISYDGATPPNITSARWWTFTIT